MTSAQKIPVSKESFDLAMSLYDRNADKKPIPVTRDMTGQKLSELTAKTRVAQRIGFVPGPHGSLGFVKLLVLKEDIIAKPTRQRRSREGDRGTGSQVPAASPRLSIDALETFVKAYRQTHGPIQEERARSVQAKIADLQRHLGIATGDDFRNTMAMANQALRELDEIDQAVTKEVLAKLNPGPQSPLFPIWRAMHGGG